MVFQHKKQIEAWIKEAETKAVSDMDFIDIIGKLFYAGYPKMRFNFMKETIIDKGLTYTPTENGECRTTDVVFTPDEVKEILQFLRESYLLHDWNDLSRAKDIKKYHNDLIDNLEMGGCWDETPEYIVDGDEDEN